MRTALLAAVSHDLRTPLAGIKAAVSTLRTPDVRWTDDDRDGLLAAIEDSADRLAAIIANLLDLSRLQTGGVHPGAPTWSGLDDVVARAVAGLARRATGCCSTCPTTCPPSASTPGCSTGSWPTSSTTRCGTRTATVRSPAA